MSIVYFSDTVRPGLVDPEEGALPGRGRAEAASACLTPAWSQKLAAYADAAG